ncbi:ankyrin repeat domain-containing protein [Desulfonema ishimotonii]|nr:ankyrin repeat domain-containing protein [Desulfonema ishimotonii]
MIRSCLRCRSLLFLLLLLLFPAPAYAHGPLSFYITFYTLRVITLFLTAFLIAFISFFIKKIINYSFVEFGGCSGISIKNIKISTFYEAVFLIILLIPHWYDFKEIYRSFKKIYLYIIDRISDSDQQVIKYFNDFVSGKAYLWRTLFRGAIVIFPIIIISFIIHLSYSYYGSDDQNSIIWKAFSIVTPSIVVFIFICVTFSYYLIIINKSDKPTAFKSQEKKLNELYLMAIRTPDSPRLIEAFLREGADVDFKGYGRQTPLHLLFCHYNFHFYRNRRGFFRKRLKHFNKKGFSGKYLKLMELLLEHGTDVNAEIWDLICSTGKKSTEEAELILKNGADINTRDNRGRTPVMKIAASRFEKTDILKILIKMGADLNLENDEGRTALMEAASNKIVGINSVSERFSGYVWQSEAVKLLLDGGANPNVRNKAGKTVLMIAASEWQLGRSKDYYEKQLKVVKTLLESGADLNSGDNSGRTVLMLTLAEWQKKPELSELYNDNRRQMIKLLLDSGADVAVKDNEGKTVSDFLTHVPPEYQNSIGDLLSRHGKRL